MLTALLLSLAVSQGYSGSPPGVGGGKVLASFPFSTTGCLATGTGGVNITRATKGTVNANGDGYTLTECQANEYRVSPDGLLVEPARTNYVRQSNTMSTGTAATAGWTLETGLTVATVAGAPVGGTWAEATSPTNGLSMYAASVVIASTATPVGSVWMAKASGTGAAALAVNCLAGGGNVTACTCGRSDGGSCAVNFPSRTYCTATVTDLGITPIRLWVKPTCTSAATAMNISAMPGGESGTGTTRFSGAQLEVGTFPTSLIVTTTTATARNADAISATVPAVPQKGWCISGNWKPTSAWPNALSLWTLGDTYNAANRASSWGNSSLYIVDAASGVKDLGAYTTPVAPWKIVTCNTAGALSLSVNGVLVDTTSTGAGTGLLTTPATTLHFGAQASAGTISDWYIKNVKVWAAKSTKEASK